MRYKDFTRLKDRLKLFAKYSSYVSDEKLYKEICDMIDKEGFTKDLYVEGQSEFVPSAKALRDIEGISGGFIDMLDENGSFDTTLPLFSHQLESLETVMAEAHSKNDAHEKSALVIQANTGGGKSESFIFPMLNHFKSHARGKNAAGKVKSGVRAILLYPMNALVLDQENRLYDYIKGQRLDGGSIIRMFPYTSKTPWDKKAVKGYANSKDEAYYVKDRNEAHAHPDDIDIMITNYSMLEYMLNRSVDFPLIGSALEFIIIDEAHLYEGSLAAEIALLLRRTLLKAGVNSNSVTFIATSATLSSDEVVLRRFYADFFDKQESSVKIIKGQLKSVGLAGYKDGALDSALADEINDELCELAALKGGAAQSKNELSDAKLFAKLRSKKIFTLLRLLLLENEEGGKNDSTSKDSGVESNSKKLDPSPIKELNWLASHLEALGIDLARISPDSNEALLCILMLGYKAKEREGAKSLLSAKLHLQVQNMRSVYVCVNCGYMSMSLSYACPKCSKEKGVASPMLELTRCRKCDTPLLRGYEEQGSSGKSYLAYSRKPKVPYNFYSRDIKSERPPLSIDENGAIVHIKSRGATYTELYVHDECPTCKALKLGDDKKAPSTATHSKYANSKFNKYFQEFRLKDEHFLPLLGNLAINMLDVTKGALYPSNGRKFLSFSDSRARAALLGILYRESNEGYMLKCALLEGMESAKLSDEEIEYYQNEIKDGRAKLARAPDKLKPKIKEDIAKYENALSLGERIEVSKVLLDSGGNGVLNNNASLFYNEEVFDKSFSFKDRPAELLEQNAKKNKEMPTPFSITELLLDELGPRGGALSLRDAGLMHLEPPLCGIDFTRFEDELDELEDIIDIDTLENGAKLLEEIIYAFCLILLHHGCYDYDVGSNDSALNNAKDEYLKAAYLGTKVVFNARVEETRERMALFNLHPNSSSENAIYVFVANIIAARAKTKDISRDKVTKFLKAVFEVFLKLGHDTSVPFVTSSVMSIDKKDESAFILQLDKFYLASTKGKSLYRLGNSLFYHHVNGVFYRKAKRYSKSELDALKVSQEELDSLPYFKELREFIRGYDKNAIFSQEHSAQLESSMNEVSQGLFAKGALNALSATTTLEVGIDIGDLSCVLLGNIPPNKAAYVQRSGRAGRKLDALSLIISYARSDSFFDALVFNDFAYYLKKPYPVPKILFELENVVARHFNAYVYMTYLLECEAKCMTSGGKNSAFDRMYKFLGYDGKTDAKGRYTLRSEDASHEEALYALLDALALGIHEDFDKANGVYNTLMAKVRDHVSMQEYIKGAGNKKGLKGRLKDAIAKFKTRQKQLRTAYNEALANAGLRNVIAKNLDNENKKSIIDVLVNAKILPRYGFPIDLQTLTIRGNKSGNNKGLYALQRSSKLAIYEYAPSASIILDGKVVTSNAIAKNYYSVNKEDDSFGERGSYYVCKNGHIQQERRGAQSPSSAGQSGGGLVCELCNEKLSPAGSYLDVREGYLSANTEPRSLRVSYDTYFRRGLYINYTKKGKGHTSNIFKIYYHEDVELFYLNEGKAGEAPRVGKKPTLEDEVQSYGNGFVICGVCGYADSMGAKDTVPKSFTEHANTYTGKKCSPPEHSIMKNIKLLASDSAEALRFEVSSRASGNLKDSDSLRDLYEALGRALLLEIAILASISERELELEVDNKNILICDTKNTGSLYNLYRTEVDLKYLLSRIEKRLYVDATHDSECERGCIRCIASLNSTPLPRRDALAYARKFDGLVEMVDRTDPS